MVRQTRNCLTSVLNLMLIDIIYESIHPVFSSFFAGAVLAARAFPGEIFFKGT